MLVKKGTSKEIIMHLFRSPDKKHTISSLTEKLKKSRVGIWKTLKSLEKDDYVKLVPMELLNRKVYTVVLNWRNPLVEKSIEMYFLSDVLNYGEWTKNFKNIENVLEFMILCKQDDKDKLIGITQKGKFIRSQTSDELQELNGKEYTISNISVMEFSQGLKNKNEEYSNVIKEGVVLFGHESFISFMKQFHYL
jgi:hypothetical protein